MDELKGLQCLINKELREKRKAVGLDKNKEQLENPRYRYGLIPPDTTIEQVNPPKEYCQCEYCGTFYNEFVSNCKNCGARIPIPKNFGKIDYIIKTNFDDDIILKQIERSYREHRLFDF